MEDKKNVDDMDMPTLVFIAFSKSLYSIFGYEGGWKKPRANNAIL